MIWSEKNKNYFFVLQELAKKDKCRENTSSVLGQMWQILTPFINMIVLVIIFSTMFANDDFVNYPLYCATGTLLYSLFNTGTTSCLTALSGNKNFLIRTQIKKDLFVVEKVYVSLIDFFFSLLVYMGIMVYSDVPFRLINILFFVSIFIFVLFIVGLGKLLAVVNVYFADIAYFYSIFTLFVFYGSAVFYDVARLSPIAQKLISINPVYIEIAISRILIIDGKMPSVFLWLKLIVYSLSSYYIGNIVFKREAQNIVAKI